jgi:hypothetical protein
MHFSIFLNLMLFILTDRFKFRNFLWITAILMKLFIIVGLFWVTVFKIQPLEAIKSQSDIQFKSFFRNSSSDDFQIQNLF